MTENSPYRLDLTALCDTISSFGDSLKILEDSEWLSQQSTAVQNTLTVGAIQNFEFVYELCIKMLRRRLELDSDNPTEIDQLSFRDTLRLAGEKGLIEKVERWFEYRSLRNITSHTYDRDKAKRACKEAAPFLKDALALLHALETRND